MADINPLTGKPFTEKIVKGPNAGVDLGYLRARDYSKGLNPLTKTAYREPSANMKIWD